MILQAGQVSDHISDPDLCLQEAGVDLARILQSEGFYRCRRVLSAYPPPKKSAATTKSSADATPGGAQLVNGTSAVGQAVGATSAGATSAGSQAGGPTDAISATVQQQQQQEAARLSRRALAPRGGANFGQALPLELPTPKEADFALNAGGLKLLESLVSPVFISTEASGRKVMGLGPIPVEKRPVLFVGNHQLFAPDMPLMVGQFLKEKNTLVRGLAHPFALQPMNSGSSKGPSNGSSPTGPLQGNSSEGTMGNGRGGEASFGAFLESFGAVQVGGFNFHRLLANGEAVLLYPGGAREVRAAS